MVVLEELESAKARGATIYGEIAGYGTTADAYRITDIPPDGHGGIAAMRMAIADAGLQPSDINYVNAHGTSTTVNDKVETRACKEVFGEDAPKVPVSSTKSMMGHLIAAAGVTEMIVCLLGDSRFRFAADDQLRKSRSRMRSGLHPQRGPRSTGAIRVEQQFWFWWTECYALSQPVRRLALRQPSASGIGALLRGTLRRRDSKNHESL